jgi:hypothetical protein
MSLFFRIFQHLLPDSLAWRIRKKAASWTYGDGSLWGAPGLLWGGTDDGRHIDRFFHGLAEFFTEPRLYIDLVLLDLYPSTTRELTEWEYQFGLTMAAVEGDRRLNVDSAWKARGGQSPRYLQDVVRAAGFDVYIHEWWSSGPAPYIARDPRDYTNVPTFGTVQCDEPLALCGEPDALCNNFLANEPGYLVNSNLTPYAPPPVPSDPTKWPFFIYWGGQTFGDVVFLDPARRQEFERLILKLCPAHCWLVTLVDYGAVPLPAAAAFPDLWLLWQGELGKTVAGSDVNAWDSTAGAAPTPISLISGIYGDPCTDGADYVQGEYDGVDFQSLAADSVDPAFASVDDDAYVAVCMMVPAADADSDSTFWLYDLVAPDLPGLVLGYLQGSAVVLRMDSYLALGDFTLASPYVVAQVPQATGSVFIIETWSDGAFIKARINGGTIFSVAWVGQKWPATFDGYYTSAGSERNDNIIGRFHQQLISRGSYPGDGACASWRAYCAQQYGYAGA